MRGSGMPGRLVSLLNLALLGRDGLALHASAVELDGTGIAACGWSGSGKTEAMLGLMDLGARFVGDEWTYLLDGRLVGLPESIRIQDWHAAQLPWLRARIGRTAAWRMRAAAGAQRGGRWLERTPRSIPGVRAVGRGARRSASRRHVDVPVQVLFDAPQRAVSAALERIVLLETTTAPAIRVEAVDPAVVSARLALAHVHHRRELMGWYWQSALRLPRAAQRAPRRYRSGRAHPLDERPRGPDRHPRRASPRGRHRGPRPGHRRRDPMSVVDAVAGDRARTEQTDTADPGVRALRARRIDWRLVLPDATPGRVLWLGEADAAALAALVEAGWSEALGATVDGADLVVVGAATSDQLATAIRAVTPGGSVYAVVAAPWRRLGRRPRPLSAARVRRRLAAAGLTGIRLHAHLPGADRRSAIVPLDEPAALHLLLRHRGGLSASGPALAAAEAARRRGWLGRCLPSVSVVARRPLAMPAATGTGSTSAPVADRDAVASWLDAVLPAEADGRPAPLLLTPSFRASRHVVALVPDAGGRRVATVAKIARIADSGTVTDRETAVLQALLGLPRRCATQRRWPSPRVGRGASRRWSRAAWTARPWTRPPSVAIPRRPLELVLPWLAALVTETHPADVAAERIARLIDVRSTGSRPRSRRPTRNGTGSSAPGASRPACAGNGCRSLSNTVM